MTQTRRERFRNATIAEIKEIARQQMADQGTAALSMRGIARQMNMSVAALYRYFNSRDEVITALLVDFYSDLGQSLKMAYESHTSLSFSEQSLHLMRTLRQWAILHPIEYELILGNPIPGYSAPMSVTQPVAQGAFEPFSRLLIEANAAHSLTIPEDYRQLPASVEQQLRLWIANFPHVEPDQISSEWLSLMYIGIIIFSRLYGLITLELFNQLPPIIGDPAASFEHEAMAIINQFNIR